MSDSFNREIKLPKFERKTVLNGTASVIPSGTVVCAIRYSGSLPVVTPFFEGGVIVGVLSQPLDPNGRAVVVSKGVITIPPTYTFRVGEIIYATVAGLTNSAVAGDSQVVGYITNNIGKLYVTIGSPAPAPSMMAEIAQDAVGNMVDGTIVYDDITPMLSRAALTGDVTAPQGSNSTTLATVNSDVGVFGSASRSIELTANAKGQITSIKDWDIVTPPVAYASKSSNYTLTSTDEVVDATAILTFTLLSAVDADKKIRHLCNSSDGIITVNTTSSQTIYLPGGPVTSVMLNDGESLAVVSTGSNWRAL